MATKKFSQMATKKLVTMLETATPEEAEKIKTVLEARQSAQAITVAPVTLGETESELTPEEQAAINAAEANGGVNPLYEGKGAENGESTKKITDAERQELADKLKVELTGHRCRVVPFNTVEWVNGFVAGIVEEKRTNKVLVAVKTDDGRRIVKTYGSKLLEILDEVVEIVKVSKGRTKKEGEVPTTYDWDKDEISEAIGVVACNVGRIISYPKFLITEKPVEGQEKVETGRIVSLVPDKRGKRILYRIELTQTTEEAEAKVAKKYTHKVCTKEDLVLAEELDELGKEINDTFMKRREGAIEKALLTPEQRIESAEKSLNSAIEQLEKQMAIVEKRKKTVEDAKAALLKHLEAEMNKVEEAEIPSADTVDDLS